MFTSLFQELTLCNCIIENKSSYCSTFLLLCKVIRCYKISKGGGAAVWCEISNLTRWQSIVSRGSPLISTVGGGTRRSANCSTNGVCYIFACDFVPTHSSTQFAIFAVITRLVLQIICVRTASPPGVMGSQGRLLSTSHYPTQLVVSLKFRSRYIWSCNFSQLWTQSPCSEQMPLFAASHSKCDFLETERYLAGLTYLGLFHVSSLSYLTFLSIG